MKLLVTGAAGFIAGYLVPELLSRGHQVVGIDNFQKYGPVVRSYDTHSNYRFVQGDATNVALMKELVADCDQVVAVAARIGGISYFHAYAYDLLAENERIMAATFDAAIWAFKERQLKKINVMSSSMVFECATVFPTPEGEEKRCPPPESTYGFQKLACEYFAKGAWQQYQLPYTIIRPFNCVGIGESRARHGQEIMSGNVRLAMSHVVPDLVQKVLKGQDPLHLLGSGQQVRHYTYAGDLARGIATCIEHPKAVLDDFNLSSPVSTTVEALARTIWERLRPGQPFRFVSDDPFPHDVQHRVPDVSKARDVLGYEATTPLSVALDEVIPWIEAELLAGRI
ncbi:MAG TPA: NAD(P)-dependent oxidoreductase [Candidatus Xenobia bacterium]|jgi:nucleoside-diphosphate-sugar epimerase